MFTQELEHMMKSDPYHTVKSSTKPEPQVDTKTDTNEQKSIDGPDSSLNLYTELLSGKAMEFLSSVDKSGRDCHLLEIFDKCDLTLMDILTDKAMSKVSLNDLASLTVSELNNKLIYKDKLDNGWTYSELEPKGPVQADRVIDITSEVNALILLQRLATERPRNSKFEVALGDQYIKVSFTAKDQEQATSLSEQIDKEVELLKEKLELELFTEEAAPQLFQYDANPIKTRTYNLSDKQYKLKIPVATKGKWAHPTYGEVKFDDFDIQSLYTNYVKDELGFRPPLYIGHQEDEAPKVGTLSKLDFEDGVLYGEWEVSRDVYLDVMDKKYTHSSAEIHPNYLSKKTGNRIGKTLFGMALTNRPFVPNLPQVEALSEENSLSDIQFFSTPLTIQPDNYDNVVDMKSNNSLIDEGDQNMSNTEQSIDKAAPKEVESTQNFSEEFQTLKEQLQQYSTKLQLVEETYKEQLAEANAKNKSLEERVQKYEERIKEEELNLKLQYLAELTLPRQVKEKYSELIKEQKLGEAEKDVLDSLKELSDNFANSMTAQVGFSEETENLNNEDYPDPYKDIVDYNKKLVEAKRSKALR